MSLLRFRYKEKFEKDKGFRFFRDKRSVLVQAISFGRRLTERQTADYVKRINVFLDDVSGGEEKSYADWPALTKFDFPDLKSEPLYKFVSDETWNYIQRGSFQLGTADYYRTTLNQKVKDEKEGASTFHDNQLNVSIISGFNCAIFCGTSLFEMTPMMRDRFGAKLIKIDPVQKFVQRICKLTGAYSGRVYDVVYTDLKNYMTSLEGIEKFIQITGKGDLSREALHRMNGMYFQIFYDLGFMPSLFSKPEHYSTEKERRIIVEMRDDLHKPTIILNDRSLLDFIELID